MKPDKNDSHLCSAVPFPKSGTVEHQRNSGGTRAEHDGLKALAHKVLQRNRARNKPEKRVFHQAPKKGASVPLDVPFPAPEMLMVTCRAAVHGTYCDCRHLAAFLTRCGDPGWCQYGPARWWAKYYDKHGKFPE